MAGKARRHTTTSTRERDAKLAPLRAELAALRAEVATLRGDPVSPAPGRGPGAPSPGAAAPSSAPPTDRLPGRPVLRRGLLASMAALFAGVVAKTQERVAHAADGQALVLGQGNASTNGTSLTRSAGGLGVTAGLSVSFDGPGADYAALSGYSNTCIGVQGSVGFGPLTSPIAGVHGQSAASPGVIGDSRQNTGVYGIAINPGPNLAIAGVVGTSTDRIGVLATSGTESGVLGISGGLGPGLGPRAGLAGTAIDKYGVLGTSSSNTGVHAVSTSAHGVFGQTSAAAGTVFNGMLAAGLAGRTSSTIALYGYADGQPNPNYAPVGGVGQCQSGFGVWGITSAGPGTVSRPGGGSPTAVSGVLGTSDSNVGVYAISGGSYALAADGNGPNTVGALIRGNASGKAAVFVGNVEIQGHLTVTGGVNGPVGAAPATAPGDSRSSAPAAPSLQAVQSPDALVDGIGEGRLVGGQAEVRFDAALAALLPDEQYHVVLTEYGDHNAIYVVQRTRQGFTVRAKDSPTASGPFSYRVVARSRTAQIAADRAPLHVPTIPVPQGVPTLPVGRETPPIAPALAPEAR